MRRAAWPGWNVPLNNLATPRGISSVCRGTKGKRVQRQKGQMCSEAERVNVCDESDTVGVLGISEEDDSCG